MKSTEKYIEFRVWLRAISLHPAFEHFNFFQADFMKFHGTTPAFLKIIVQKQKEKKDTEEENMCI